MERGEPKQLKFFLHFSLLQSTIYEYTWIYIVSETSWVIWVGLFLMVDVLPRSTKGSATTGQVKSDVWSSSPSSSSSSWSIMNYWHWNLICALVYFGLHYSLCPFSSIFVSSFKKVYPIWNWFKWKSSKKKPFLDGPMLDFRGVFLVDFLKIGEQRNNQNQWFPHEKMTNSLG